MPSAQFVFIVLILAIMLAAAAIAFRFRGFMQLVIQQKHGADRDKLWDILYGLDWTGTTTNNYGFAPAETQDVERFQLQMYAELLKLHMATAKAATHTDLLEVSCGQGGGLAHLVNIWPSPLSAVGLDKSQNAINACRRTHAGVAGLRFVQGDALALPFPDASFDVVVNVEAAGDYNDMPGFCREVHRVLRPNGVFLFADTCRAKLLAATKEAFLQSGFVADFRDIAPNVMQACVADTPRRLDLIKARVPFLYRWLFRRKLENYAAVEGSIRLRRMREGRLGYIMTCARPIRKA